MASETWKVRIPAGRWMAGVNHFKTKALALDFIDRWNKTEASSGKKDLRFHRFGPRTFEPLEE